MVSDVVSDIVSDIVTDMFSDIVWDIFSDMVMNVLKGSSVGLPHAKVRFIVIESYLHDT